MPHPANTSEPRLLRLLTDSQSAMARLFDSRARHLGLTRPQWRIILGLYGNDGMTQTELSEATAIGRSPLGKIIDQLEKKNLLERRCDPHDRRINRLYFTEAITPLLSPARQFALELEEAIRAGMPADVDLTSTLERLRSRLLALTEHDHESIPYGKKRTLYQ